MVIASIHQPSHATLSEFNSLVLLSQGYVCYRGATGELERFLTQMGIECAPFVSDLLFLSVAFSESGFFSRRSILDRFLLPIPRCSFSTPTSSLLMPGNVSR